MPSTSIASATSNPSWKRSSANPSAISSSITWSGTDRGDKNATGPRFTGVFTITVWSKPVISPDDLAADEIVQLVCQILDDHRPLVNGRESHMQDRWVVMGAAILEHPSLLVHRIPVQIPIQIPKL
ncbi:MAG: hypothetical protein QM755_02815 [Luteolibacter sp.]